MNYQKLLKKAEKTVEGIAGDHYLPAFLFHNIDRICSVVRSCEKIAGYSVLNEEESFILLISAWFFDTGAVSNNKDQDASVNYAANFLAEHQLPQAVIDRVTALILAVSSDIAPANPLEEIIRDAVTYYYGKKTYLETFEQERKEKELLDQTIIDRDSWLKQVLVILQRHIYFTIFCRQSLDEGKLKNITELTKMLNQVPAEENIQKKNPKIAEQEKIRPEKAIDGMFRIAESNSQRLSSMADNKAHILITVNSIILSVVISILLRKLDDNRDLILPTILLLAVSLASMSFSILATRPSLPRLNAHPSQIQRDNMNLLFFGNFYHMGLDSYETEMHKMMENSGLIYNCLIKDIHTEGIVLARKYKLLRTAYNIFMFGLIAATLAFIIASVIQPPKLTPSAPNNTNSNKISLHHP